MYLHANDIIHRDLKVNFILFSRKIFYWTSILTLKFVISAGVLKMSPSRELPFVAPISTWPQK